MNNQSNTELRAISIVRVSTILQTEENGGTGIQFQTEKLQQYADLNDMNLIKTIKDVASGGLSTRDGIEELKQDVIEGNVDVVLIWAVSRAFRSMIAFTKFYEFLKNHNVELISTSEGIRSSRKEGELLFSIMCGVASYEKDVIKERLTSGRMTKVKNGIRGFGSKVPFGYCKNDNGDIVQDKINSKIVQYIFKTYNRLLKDETLDKNRRTRKLIKLMTRQGFTYYGKKFRSHNVKHILNSEFYIGTMKYGDMITKHNYPRLVSKRMFNQVCIS